MIRDYSFWGFTVFAFISGIGLGLFRFAFPFLIIADGLRYDFIASVATVFSIAIVMGLCLGMKVGRSGRQFLLLIIIFCLIPSHLLYIIGGNEIIWLLARFLDGLVFGITYYLILSIAIMDFPEKAGEKSSILLAATYLGSAGGQFLYAVLLDYSSILKIVPLVLGIASSVFLIIIFNSSLIKFTGNEREHGHIRKTMRNLFTRSSIALTLLIALVEISHGVYTPILPVLLEINGLSQAAIGFAFFYFNIGWSAILIVLGRYADRLNPKFLLILGPLLKGPLILMYLISSTITVLIVVLVLIGIAEGLFEPAKNVYLSKLEDNQEYEHNHYHFNLSGEGLVHSHFHYHSITSVDVGAGLAVSTYLFFAVGTLISSLLLFSNFSLTIIVIIGAIAMTLASVAGKFVKN